MMRHLTANQLQQLNDKVDRERSLLIFSDSFRCRADRWPHLTAKNILNALLCRSEWEHDDASVQVENSPQLPTKQKTSLFDELEEPG
jgi:adenine-specific DNA-methyltransferase